MLALPLLLLGCIPQSIPLTPRANPDFTYLLEVASFQDSDGDGVGDLQGVRWHVQHIRSLGVGTVQLLPLEPGWDVGRLLPAGSGVDPALGTEADLAALAEDLHVFGMTLEVQVPMDAVGRAHPWFDAALRGEGRIQLGLEGGEGWYPTGDDRYYYASHQVGEPDLDWDDAGLPGDRAEALLPLLEAGVDGVLLRPFATEGERAPDDVADALFGELEARLPGLRAATAPTASTVDTLLPWTALGPVADLPRALAWEAATSDRDFRWVDEVLEQWGDEIQTTRPFLGDAERSRLANRVPDAELRRTLMVLHLLGPGHPSLYYGEELDLADATTDPVDAPWRAPMAWDSTHNCGFTTGEPWFKPDPACKVGWNAYDEARVHDSMLTLVRWLAAARQAWGSSRAERVDTGFVDVTAFRAGDLLVVGSFAGADRVLPTVGLRGVDLVDGTSVLESLAVPARGWRVIRVLD